MKNKRVGIISVFLFFLAAIWGMGASVRAQEGMENVQDAQQEGIPAAESSPRSGSEAIGNVHGLVVSGRASHESSMDKMYQVLCDNKLPFYKTAGSNIERYCIQKDSTREEFLEKMGTAFQGSGENDLNVFFYSGHAGGSFFAVTTKYELPSLEVTAEEMVTFEEFLQRLSTFKGKFAIITNACGDAGLIEQAKKTLSEEDIRRFSFFTACTNSTESSIWTLFPDLLLKKLGYEEYSDLEADTSMDGAVTASELGELTVSIFNKESDLVGNWFYSEDLTLFQFAYTKQKTKSVDLDKGKEYTLKADILCAGGRKRQAKWKSADPSVASVDALTGKVTAVSEGTAIITSYLEDDAGNMFQGSESECTVIVEAPSITLNKKEASFYEGESISLKATVKGKDKAVSWESSSPKVAAVKNGKVTGKAAGKATITAKANGVKASCKVTVKKPSISLSPKSVTLYAGDAKQIKAIKKGIKGNLSWSSSKKSVAAVSSKGKIKAKKPGKATITAKRGKYSAKCNVVVKKEKAYKAMYTHTSWEEKERKIGSLVFSFESYYIKGQGTKGYLYVTKNGVKTLVVSGMGLSSNILTNGKYLYCSANNSAGTKATIYRIPEIGGNTIKRLFSVDIVDGGVNFQGYYDGKIYFVKGLDTTAYFCSYDTKKKKVKKIEPYIQRGRQVEQYFYLTLYEGDYNPTNLWVYDAKNGKKKLISKKKLNYYIVSDYVYYVESKASGRIGERGYFDVAVKRCKLNGSGKKTVIKNLRITGCKNITKDAIWYYDLNRNLKKKKL